VSPTRLTIVRDPNDQIVGAPSVRWALDRLAAAWANGGGNARITGSLHDVADGPLLVLGTAATKDYGGVDTPALPDVPESFVLQPGSLATGPVVHARGSDVRGTTYAVLELADRVEHEGDSSGALMLPAPIVGRPANAVRSVTRLFCSEVEDLGWFRDRGFWDRYLSMLVMQRFNRFSLTLGLGYNYHRNVTDAYLYFAYPFVVSVPGYDVHVPQLAEEERETNLATLRSISDMAVARGLGFQLGLWNHACEWIESPNAHHTVEGLAPETHAAYCRDAVRMLLEECPAISGLTFRVHGESGVPEGSWDFWRTVFEGVATCGRRVGIDLHAKGLDERTLDAALDTGLPITVSPKFWAEHMGLPYHQAAIRESERLPREDPSGRSEWHRYMRVSEGSRPFTRYGYGDFLREDRAYDVVFRLWAGTQRLLLWGDPAFAAGYGRVASLAGSQGLEWCEPLTFKGREGSGLVGSRTGYDDPSLIPDEEWEKYSYAFRLFGRLTYDPDAPAEVWRRTLRAPFGAAARHAESALANASRILPLVTVAHHPSASNNYYWPEIYTDMPIVWTAEGTRPHPYLDTPEPRRFGTVSPLDPEVFSSASDFVREAIAGEPSGRLSPFDVAGLLDQLAHLAATGNAALVAHAQPTEEVRRWTTDIAIQTHLGRFFAGKMRAAVWYEVYAATGSRQALRLALDEYRSARDAWSDASSSATGVYVDDLTFGPQPWIRGHWADRLAGIDADLRDLEARWASDAQNDHDEGVGRLLQMGAHVSGDINVLHEPPEAFIPGEKVELSLRLRGPGAGGLERVTVRYRPMDQALRFSERPMERSGDDLFGSIPAAAADGAFPLAYAFVLYDLRRIAWRYPGLGDDLASQPYFILRPSRAKAP
jgi:hypothetical protein